MANLFKLTQQQKNNINRRLIRGFCLVKREILNNMPKKQKVVITYSNIIPQQNKIIFAQIKPPIIQPKIQQPPLETVVQTILPQPPVLLPQISLKSAASFTSELPPLSTLISRQSSDLSLIKPKPIYNTQSSKHKNSERLKMIVQKFKKHKKFGQLTHLLGKTGCVNLSRVEQQVKKHLHTLQSFKVKVLQLLEGLKLTIQQQQNQGNYEVVQQMIMLFQNLITQEKQVVFQTSLQQLQKNVDRITRELGQIKEQGQWYVKKKKKSDKFADQKQIIYICDLIKTLPKAYMVGVWQIIFQKPFREKTQFKNVEVDFSQLKTRKIRQIQYYVKKKLQNLKKSRQRKKQKIEKLLKNNQQTKITIEHQNQQNRQNQQNQQKQQTQQNNQNNQMQVQQKVVKLQENEETQKQIEYDSSDSSMITEDQQSLND